MKIFRFKSDEVIGRWRKLHKEELRILHYSTLNFLNGVKMQRITKQIIFIALLT
jgi:hypothetical protein